MITKNGGFAPLLSTDGETLYYSKSPALSSDVWSLLLVGGNERRIIDGAYRFSFAPAPEGIYYMSAPQFRAGSFIRFLRLTDNHVTDVLRIADPADLGLGISPDYRSLFFAKVDHSESDIMLVENVK
jgi:hypothetical protein